MTRTLILAVALSALLSARALAKDPPKVHEAGSLEEVKPGQTRLLKTAGGVAYFVRLPKSYDEEEGARLIVFLHGSNMNGLTYIRSFEARGWGKDDILACPNGEKGADPFGANNFTFGSAPLVAEVTREVKEAFRVTRTYVGGHSQGGFLTYSVITNFPDLYEGAIPMAGDCWSQNEPNLWETKPEVLAKQKEIAIAVIHGRADPVVNFSQGQHAYDVFNVMGWPKLKLYAPERLGHQFMLSPVDEALDWLDAMVGDDPAHCLKIAEAAAKRKEWADAVPAARRVLELKGVSSALRKKAKRVLGKAEKAAKKPLEAMKEEMDLKEPRDWLFDFFAFRRQFGGTDAAEKLVKRYAILRAKHREEGARLFGQAFRCFRSEQKEKGYELLEELLKKAPASYDAYYAVKWLADREED